MRATVMTVCVELTAPHTASNIPHHDPRKSPKMEVSCNVNLNGLEEKLQELGPKFAKKALRKALAASGDYWVAEMKARVPVDSGDLRESIDKKIKMKRGKGGAPSSATVSVGPTFGKTPRQPGDGSQQPGVYGMFEEFGTKRQSPQPFVRPTFDATADQVVSIFVDVLRGDLEDVAKS
jgi:HK97 gp10 family phage protein